MRTHIRGLGGILTGDLAAPRSDGAEILVEDGRIVEIGGAMDATRAPDRVVDAEGAWAAPGLWDASAALYFGDHEPRFSARGAIAAAVEYGTTTLVIGGRVAVPGWIGTPRANRELAVLTIKSWRFDRPLGIKVVPGVIEGDPAWTADDLSDLAAAGAQMVMINAAADGAPGLADSARHAGLRVGVPITAPSSGTGGNGGTGGTGGTGDAVTIEAIGALQPDVVMLRGAPPFAVHELLEGTTAGIGVVLTGGIGLATQVVCAAADRSALGRIFLGSGLPDRPGVLPGAIALFLETMAATTGLGTEQLMALATSNVARAFGHEGGVLAPGQPADLVLRDPAGGPMTSWAQPISATFIDGNPVWRRAAGR